MPTYEYQCAKGHTFEAFQRISDKPKTKCPECGAKATRIISGGAGLIFKGSGFYITDYGKDGKGPRKDGGSSESPPPATDSTPAPKAETPAPAPKAEAPAPKKSSKKGKSSA